MRRRAAWLATVALAAFAVIGCETGTGSTAVANSPGAGGPSSAPPQGPVAGSPSANPAPTLPPRDPPPAPSAAPSASPEPAPTSPPGLVRHDPRTFGFAAKGMSHEVLGFVTSTQVDEAVRWLDLSAISTIAYFSLEADDSGRIARDYGWRVWNSPRMSALIRKAHASGTKVVISLERFSWSPGQTAVSRALLASGNRRLRLAREVAAEVSRRGVDGVNVDFEPIPVGLRTNFTKFVESLRAELDRRGPGYQLTFAITGHHESYDVRALLRRGGADAVYLMGYHYAGTWSTRAGSTAPIGGSRYDVRDTVRRLLRVGRPNQIIVGVPYYGHLWPTVGSGLYAPTRGGGYDVLYHQAAAIARQHGSSLDRVEGVRRVVYRARACASCRTGWYQLYYDDAGTLGRKWAFVKRQRLLGTGIWTVPFEGRPGPLNSALRKAFLIAD